MAERDGQRVSDVVWGRRLLEVEEQLDHLLHLVLLCTAVADDRALDRCGRVGHDRHAGFRGGEQRDAARLAELERTAHVAGVKYVLDRDAVGPMLHDERLQPVVNRVQLVRECRARRTRERATDHEYVAAADPLDAAVAGAARAWIDPEDPHANEASISFSSMSAFDQTFLESSWSSRMSISLTICCAGFPSSFT